VLLTRAVEGGWILGIEIWPIKRDSEVWGLGWG
jgi:hypothetical protein